MIMFSSIENNIALRYWLVDDWRLRSWAEVIDRRNIGLCLVFDIQMDLRDGLS
jgi:hypothetical protein